MERVCKPVHVYKVDTGQITCNTTAYITYEDGLPTLELDLAEGLAWDEGEVDDSEFYIDTATLEPTPLKLFQDVITVTTNTISNVPVGTSCIAYNMKEVVDDGVLELDVPYPEIIKVVMFHPTYKRAIVEVPCE